MKRPRRSLLTILSMPVIVLACDSGDDRPTSPVPPTETSTTVGATGVETTAVATTVVTTTSGAFPTSTTSTSTTAPPLIINGPASVDL